MRRILLVVVASCAALAAVPAFAVAHHTEHHKRAERHHRHHRRHHDRVRREHFGASSSSSTSGDQQDQGNAGTVASFTGGVLTIRLSDGSTVSGAVTADTNIECEMAETDMDMQAADEGPGGGDNSGDDDSGQGDDQGEDEQPCASVMPGMVVRKAELRISGAGAVWDEVDLIS